MISKRLTIVGHRGWPTRFPENSLAGVTAAASVADFVEIDVRRAANGKLTLSHDPIDAVDLALLDEALSGIPDTPAQIEIKNEPWQPDFEPDHRLGLEATERSRPGDLLTSFNWATIDRIHQLYPEVSTGLVVGAIDAMEVAVQLCLDSGHRAIVPRWEYIDETIAAALATGIDVYAWTVNDAATARELAGLGVSGIITDDPGMMREVFEE